MEVMRLHLHNFDLKKNQTVDLLWCRVVKVFRFHKYVSEGKADALGEVFRV